MDIDNDNAASPCCPECGYPDLVRTRVRPERSLDTKEGALCVTCGHRFPVDHAVFKALRYPTTRDSYVSVGDLHHYMYNFPMSRTQVITSCVAGVLGGIFGVWLGLVCDQWLAGLIFFPILYLGWWLGHWLDPPKRVIPGRCPKCQYNLRGVAGNQCPECGEPIENDG